MANANSVDSHKFSVVADHFYHSLCIGNASVSQQKDLFWISLNGFAA
jgi:hypothetical protein